MVNRFAVYWADLDPTVGSEIRKSRPCVIVSPDELNRYIATVIVAPMTSGARPYPWRVNCNFQGRVGQIVLDQLRTVDKSRLGQRMGMLQTDVASEVLAGLARLFAP